jgi:hypothetical protein
VVEGQAAKKLQTVARRPEQGSLPSPASCLLFCIGRELA